MSEFVSVDRINALKSGIEAKTGRAYADLTAGVQALVDGFGQGEGGSSGSLFQTADIVVDNTTAVALVVDIDDDTLDNYAMDAVIIETGVYTDGVLVLDETPTVPIGMNIPVQSGGVNLKTPLNLNVLAGTVVISDKSASAGSCVIRGSLSTYGGNYVFLGSKGDWQVKKGQIGIGSGYFWGKPGYYFKFRVNVYGWNNP